MNEQQAACSLGQRVLYELQVLCDAGALLRPDIDGELIPLLAAAEARHGEGAVQRRYGEDEVVKLLRHMHTRAWEAQSGGSRPELRSRLAALLESGERLPPQPGGAAHAAASTATRKIIEVRRVVVTPSPNPKPNPNPNPNPQPKPQPKPQPLPQP